MSQDNFAVRLVAGFTSSFPVSVDVELARIERAATAWCDNCASCLWVVVLVCRFHACTEVAARTTWTAGPSQLW